MRGANVLWICTDQQRFDTLGCYANRFVRTPNLDRLAREGILFERCYVQSPVCMPSRASFLTGRYPRTTRCRQNGQIIPPDEKPISRLFADAGYYCGLVGKFHLAPGDPDIAKTVEPRINDGYSEFCWAQSPTPLWGMHSGYTTFLAERGLQFSIERHPKCPYIEVGMPTEASEAAWCADKAMDFIRRQSAAQRPWFYSVNIFAPHHPFAPPPE
jgi:arylsulfatase A-like enzyme